MKLAISAGLLGLSTACAGGQTAGPVGPVRSPAGPRSANADLTAVPAGSSASSEAACGGFEQRPMGKRMPLLGGRLFVTPLEGAVDSARPTGVMDAPNPDETETRLVLKDGDEKLVIFSEEIFARPAPDLVNALRKSDARLASLPMEERILGGGLRTVFATHPDLKAPNETIPVAHAYTVLPDDTLQATHVFVNPAVVRAGGGGCVALAEKILGTLKIGPRRLDLGGGPRPLEAGTTLTLPRGFVVVPQRGPDFSVYRVFPVRAISTPTGQLGIYFGNHPDFERDPKATATKGRLLGKNVIWSATSSNDGIHRETLVELGTGLRMHVFIAAPTEADADELQRVAETLERTR